jgi:hypothetical protein
VQDLYPSGGRLALLKRVSNVRILAEARACPFAIALSSVTAWFKPGGGRDWEWPAAKRFKL